MYKHVLAAADDSEVVGAENSIVDDWVVAADAEDSDVGLQEGGVGVGLLQRGVGVELRLVEFCYLNS